MGAWPRSWRRIIRKHWVVAITVALMALFALIICVGYALRWGWTGFLNKTLWDWFNLLGVLAIPAVVGFGAVWYTGQQGKVSDRENKDNQRETALQAYIDKMSELLLDKNLSESRLGDTVRDIARARTLTLLHRLDDGRKRSVVQFLYENNLIKNEKHIVDLAEADLSSADLGWAYLPNANLSYADLRDANICLSNLIEANLSGADLSNAKLWEAKLRNANLSRTNLSNADLKKADLSDVDLREANLFHADMRSANLKGAKLNGDNPGDVVVTAVNLSRADLSGADLTGANLREAILLDVNLRGTIFNKANLTNAIVDLGELENTAKSLKGATMPDGTKHD
jgi:uncharacterized protein YjbI with pentapeptide repeats